MEAKEKAKELVEKYADEPINFPYIDNELGTCIGAGYMTFKSAKQCALIAVEEIIELDVPGYPTQSQFDEHIDRWLQVKAEIEKLNMRGM